jgi:hypothetical protein
MLVLVMMDEARKPENWMWMGFKVESEEGQEPESVVSPRLADLFRSSSEDNSLFQALARSESGSEDSTSRSEQGRANPLDETLLQVLRRCFAQLSDDQLQRLFMDLDQLLSFKPLTDNLQPEREQIASRIQRVVDFELSQYRQLVARTAEDQLNASAEDAVQEQDWESLLNQVQGRFDLLTSLLRSTIQVDELTIGQLQEVTHFQQQLDQVALEQIEDNTLGPRAAEQHAWYRTFELMEKVEQEGGARATGRVTTFDLAQQPDQYRGRWVELQGQVRELKKVSLANNREGFQDYWEMWVRPNSGPDVPFCVYARSLPEGFPSPESATESLSLKEPVTIIGCFFKNMSYRAVGGLRVSPLVLVAAPQWSPQPEQVAATRKLPTWQEMIGIAVICLLIAVMVAWWVYRATRLRLPSRHQLDRSLLILFAISVGWVGMSQAAEGQEKTTGSTARPPWLLPDQPDSEQTDFHSVYQLFEDIEPSQLDRLGDFQDLNYDEPIVQQILSRLAVVGPRWLEERSQVLNRELAEVIAKEPSRLRGEFIACRGAIQSVELVELSEATWNQFERDVVFRIQLDCDLGDGVKQSVTVYSNHVPPAWEALEFPVDEAAVAGVLVQLGENAADGQPQPILVADRVAWFPVQTPIGPWQRFWCDHGFDYGRWEVARAQEGRPLQAADGSCFYGLLNRASQIELGTEASRPAIEALDLFEVLRDPNEQRGALFQFQGIVKRVTEISTGEDLYATDEGVSRYFQVDMLLSLDGRRVRLGTEETGATITGRYPVTVCVRELPEGLEVGEELSQRVAVLAAFFRNWKYRSEYLRRVDEDLRQLSPMLIGVEIQTLGIDESSTFLTQIAVGVLVIGAVLSGLGFLFLRRSDLKYQRERAKLKKASLPDQLDWVEESDS